jgi:16S rRNA (uracil1498-N3)-methyltransferase
MAKFFFGPILIAVPRYVAGSAPSRCEENTSEFVLMSLPRFLVPSLPKHGSVELPESEAHHASRVLRCAQGETIELFDGLGVQATATIRFVDKRSVVAEIESFEFAPRDHAGRLHFAIALPKGDRQRNTIEKLVELGVDSLAPLVTTRSVALVNEANTERIERYVMEACKQCRRNRLMHIRTPLHMHGIRNYADSIVSQVEPIETAVWILHPPRHGKNEHTIHQANAMQRVDRNVLFLVGPEGGFTDTEVDEAVEQGANVLTLGERIQRVETAASTAAVLGHCWLAENC